MSYDLHITRASDWADNSAHQITAREWLAVVEADPELQAQPDTTTATWKHTWFQWQEGNVAIENPSESGIQKAVNLAVQLRATVQGDDGEVYGTANGQNTELSASTFGDRVANLKNALSWHLWTRWTIKCPFHVGGRVIDCSGRQGVVVALAPHAERGAGTLTVRFDDGAEQTSLLIAPGVEALHAPV